MTSSQIFSHEYFDYEHLMYLSNISKYFRRNILVLHSEEHYVFLLPKLSEPGIRLFEEVLNTPITQRGSYNLSHFIK